MGNFRKRTELLNRLCISPHIASYNAMSQARGVPVFSQPCLINPNRLLTLLFILRTSPHNRFEGGLFELWRSNHCRLFRLQFMGVEAAWARRRQTGSKRFPVPDWTMLFVNG